MHSNDSDGGTGWDRKSPREDMDYDFDHDRGCPKCESQEVFVGQFRSGGSTGQVLLDIPGKAFRRVGCRDCGYLELYQHSGDDAEVVDTFLE